MLAMLLRSRTCGKDGRGLIRLAKPQGMELGRIDITEVLARCQRGGILLDVLAYNALQPTPWNRRRLSKPSCPARLMFFRSVTKRKDRHHCVDPDGGRDASGSTESSSAWMKRIVTRSCARQLRACPKAGRAGRIGLGLSGRISWRF
jgi:hypothetical protein